jgi:hypothetical protein
LVETCIGAIANVGFVMLTLYFVFVAAGALQPGHLVRRYGLHYFSEIAFITPGGLGVVKVQW